MESKKIQYYGLWVLTAICAAIALRDLFPNFLKKVDWLTLVSTVGGVASFVYQIRQSTKGAAKDELKNLEDRLRQEDEEIRKDLFNFVESLKNNLNEDAGNVRTTLNELLLRQRSHEREPGHQKLLDNTIAIYQKVVTLETKMEILSMILNNVFNIKTNSIFEKTENPIIENSPIDLFTRDQE